MMNDSGAARTAVVVGGGLVGLNCAYHLARAGVAVTVLERGHIGGGAARFNAGMVTTSVTPLPEPGLLRSTVGTAFLPDSAIRVSPRLTAGEALFFTRFARFCNETRYVRGLEALLELNRDCYALYDELESAGVAAGLERSGYLICCSSAETAASCWAAYDAMPAVVGRPGPVLEGAALRELEPALSPKAGAGFLHIDERWVDASPFVDRLGRAIVDAGGRVVEGARVTSVRETSSDVVVHSSAGNHAADHVVIAAGVWSEDICRELGVRLGMQPGKGYSFSVGGAEMPRRLVYFSDAHAVATPIDGRVRIAGTMEFDGTRDRFNRRRVEAMVRAVSPLLPGLDWSDVADEWVAPRPMTPDGLPLIGWLHGSRRVLVASGHNMLGLTLGPPTGRLIAGLVCDEPVAVDVQPFSPARFASVHSGDGTGRAMWRKSPA